MSTETEEAVPPSATPPSGLASTPVELWTPRGIGWASALLGYPGGVILAALNWRRMDRTRKAVVHLAVAVIGTWAYFGWVLVQPRAGSVGIMIVIVVSYYLFRVQRSDQASFASTHRVAERSGLLGAAIAVGGTLAIVGSILLVAAARDQAVSHRGEVLFSKQAATDVCSPTAPTKVFGAADPIFEFAIMRETVQVGARVVFTVDGPGGTTAPQPVNLQPPFDCAGSTGSIGPMGPGTYVFHYRYADRPGTPDLATGTFTVQAPSSGSATRSFQAVIVSPGLSANPTPTSDVPFPSAVSSGFPHQDPDLETRLPASVGGRALTRWSVRGQDFLAIHGPVDAATLSGLEQELARSGLTLDDISQATAGRSSGNDPPFFVLAIRVKGQPAEAIPLGMGVSDHASSGWTPITVAGKNIQRGTAEMLTQDSHIRGIPYVYSVGDIRFVVVGDQSEWVREAVGQLP